MTGLKDQLQRLDERETALFRERDNMHGDAKRKTLHRINRKRKQDMMDDYHKNFASRISPGINKTNFSFHNIIVRIIVINIIEIKQVR